MRLMTGSPVQGEDFMFRNKELKLTRQTLADGSSMLVKGWRRIGKSSLLAETARLLQEENPDSIVILVDVQDLVTMSEFLSKIVREMPKDATQMFYAKLGEAKQVPGKLMNAIKAHVKSATGGAGGIKGGVEFDQSVTDYWEPLKLSFESLAKEQVSNGNRVILLIDELPFFLENLFRKTENVDDLRTILSTLRSWRNAGVAMAIAGSVSIEAFLEDVGIEGLVLNDLVRLDLNPLKLDEAKELVQTLSAVSELNYWTEDATEYLLESLPDHYPFFIQNAMNFMRVEDDCERDTIDDVFENQIYPQLFASFFQQFDERLEKRFEPAERNAAEAILNAMAQTENGHLSVPEITEICEGAGVDPLKTMRRLELSEFIKLDPKGGYKLVQNLLKNWRSARGGM